ncbi:hypothetical protein TNCV_841721 [Trichonephila clavipes]|nr:hypothetical protein TNCV_841721 [Trichonephila clavipes]
MAFFKAIGVIINESGLSHMMIESNIIASGPVNGLVEDKDSLYNIATAQPVPENVTNFLLNIEKKSEDLRKQFLTECAEDQDRFDKPIKNQVLNFAGAPKKKKNNSW